MPDIHSRTNPPAPTTPKGLNRPLLQAFLTGILALVLYLNNLHGAFIFDDWAYIAENPLIRDFTYFRHIGNLREYLAGQGITLSHIDLAYNFVLRPVTYLTYAINYSLHGTDPGGYHLLNNLLHVAATMLAFLFTHLLIGQLRSDTGENGYVRWIPVLVALIFACHPVHTQAVSYTVQRFTPLVACCYLLALSAYLLSRRSDSRAKAVSWYLLGLTAAVAGMLSKENAFTLPLMITSLELLCFRGTIGKRLVLLLPFMATMAIIPLGIMALSGQDASLQTNLQLVNFDKTPHPTYLFTEFRVLATYLRLLVLPLQQRLDYDYPLYDSFFAPPVMASLLFLLALASVGAYALFIGRKTGRSWLMLAGFGILWFFVTLSVESGLVPMDDVIFEHRLYLPSVGFFIAATAVGTHLMLPSRENPRRRMIGLTVLFTVLTIFSIATVRRNGLWADTTRFMEDNAAKSPRKERVQILLADTYLREGKPHQAIAVYERIPLTHATPQHLYTNLANAYIRTGDTEKGVLMYYRAMAHNRDDFIPYSMLGTIFMTQGNHDAARELLDTAIRLNRFDLVSRKARAELFRKQGNMGAAGSEYENILRISPNDSDALNMLKKLRK